MPTIATARGYRVVVYSNVHEPEHVHVIGPDSEARFALNCHDGPAELIDSVGMKSKDLRYFVKYLTEIIKQLCAEWVKIHGEPKKKRK
jgi:hypothetical protein